MVTEDRPIGENLEGSECCHHWVIEAAGGPLSEGICQKCGEAKTFTNYIEQDKSRGWAISHKDLSA